MTTKEKLNILLSAIGIPKPVKVNETKEHLTIVWDGNQSMNGGIIVDVLKSNDINYPDPRGNTIDTLFTVERATNTTVRTIMTMDRLNKAGYDKILNTAVDKDGDGKKELEPATDAEEKVAVNSRKTASKNV